MSYVRTASVTGIFLFTKPFLVNILLIFSLNLKCGNDSLGHVYILHFVVPKAQTKLLKNNFRILYEQLEQL